MSEATPPAAGSYPVTYDVEPQLTNRNRKTCGLRIIWALPHWIIVGGGASFFGYFILAGAFASGDSNQGSVSGFGGTAGGLGAAAGTMAVVAWFAIMFAHTHPRGLWDFASYYMRWYSKAMTYLALLRDDYPPFGDGDYPVRFTIADMPSDGQRRSVGWRLILIIPHGIVLVFIGLAWYITSFFAWVAILFTGSYPEGLYKFSIGYLRWSMRVQSYLLLLHDEYPPFSLD